MQQAVLLFLVILHQQTQFFATFQNLIQKLSEKRFSSQILLFWWIHPNPHPLNSQSLLNGMKVFFVDAPLFFSFLSNRQLQVILDENQSSLEYSVKTSDGYFLSNFYFSPNDSPPKTMRNVFLFHLKSSFWSRDIQIFVFLSSPLFFSLLAITLEVDS